MARCFKESKRAHASGYGAQAKTLSNERKAHAARMEQLNAEASAWIYASESRSRKLLQSMVPDDLMCLLFSFGIKSITKWV
jgi:hypothetical protein